MVFHLFCDIIDSVWTLYAYYLANYCRLFFFGLKDYSFSLISVFVSSSYMYLVKMKHLAPITFVTGFCFSSMWLLTNI